MRALNTPKLATDIRRKRTTQEGSTVYNVRRIQNATEKFRISRNFFSLLVLLLGISLLQYCKDHLSLMNRDGAKFAFFNQVVRNRAALPVRWLGRSLDWAVAGKLVAVGLNMYKSASMQYLSKCSSR